MHAVGLRELKNRLSEYIRRVRAGESVLITDRGAVVAELRPPGRAALEQDPHPGLTELVRAGLATHGGRNDPELYPELPRLVPEGTASELIDSERGER